MSNEHATKPEPEMITLRQACKRIGKSFTWCYEVGRRDEFIVPVYHVGDRYLVSRIALEEIFKRQHPVK